MKGDEQYECKQCHELYELGDGLEPTDYCNTCAQELVATLRTHLKSVEAERDRYKLSLNRLLVGDHVGTPINRGCGAMSVIEDALSWTDAEVEQFMKEWDEGKHRLSPEDERALEASKHKLFQRIKSTSETDH